MRRFVVAFVVLILGAVFSTFFVLIATNGYGTAGGDTARAALAYLVIALLLAAGLAWLSAAVSRWLSARLAWRGYITLPLVLVPLLVLELFLLLFAGVSTAALSTPIG